MNLKKAIIGLKISLVTLTANAQVSLEQKHDTLSEKPHTEKAIPSNSIDTLNEKNSKDSLLLEKIKADSIAQEWGNLSVREKLRSCSDQMLLFITQFEDIRARAYWDNVGKEVTAGAGFVYIDGKKISRNFRFKNMKHLTDTWHNECERPNGWFDIMEAYLGKTIELMHPQTEKELLQCKSELCGWHSFVWQNGPASLGSYNQPSSIVKAARLAQETNNETDQIFADSLFNKYATSLVKAYTSFKQTGDTVFLNKAETYFKAWNKVTKKNKQGHKVKVILPASVARRKAEFDYICGNCIITVGDKPETLREDTTVQYIDILEVVVGAIYSLKDKQTGALPNDWPKQAQTIKGDTITTSYQREFPELKQAPQKSDSTKVPQPTTNPIIRFFRNLRDL